MRKKSTSTTTTKTHSRSLSPLTSLHPQLFFNLRSVVGGGAVGRGGAHELAHAMAEGGEVCCWFRVEWKDLRLRFFWLALPRLSSESVADALALRGPLLLSASKRTRALSKNAAETRCQSAKPAGA